MIQITEATGAVVTRRDFRPFGDGEGLEWVDPLTQPKSKGFIGERFDPETGLQYLHARYYDPKLALFTQGDWWDPTDPGVGTNRYMYSLGDPVNLSDPNGHSPIAIGVGISRGLKALADIARVAGLIAAAENASEEADSEPRGPGMGHNKGPAMGQDDARGSGQDQSNGPNEPGNGPRPSTALGVAAVAVGVSADRAVTPSSQKSAALPAPRRVGNLRGGPLENATQVSGNFSLENGPPNGTTFRADNQGNITSYATYDARGQILKRVDVTGKPHNGVETPHVTEYGRNSLPNGSVRVDKPRSDPRPATKGEIP